MVNCYKSSFQECITIIVLKIELTRNQPPYCLLQLPEKSFLFVFFKLNNYFISKTKKPVTKQANSKELISYTVSYTKVYTLHNSRWEKETE